MVEQYSCGFVGRAARNAAKAAWGIGAALLVLAVGPAATAYAATDINVPCEGPGGGSVGLIAAINAANSSGGGRINLERGCTYTLTAPDNLGPVGANGLPVIKTTIAINASGHENEDAAIEGDNSVTTIAGNASFRIFEVDGPGPTVPAPGGNLTLNRLTITKGAAPLGGGILNLEGVVTLNHSRVTGNTGFGGGGGIASGTGNTGPLGTITLNSSQVDANTALSGGGGGILNHAGTLILISSRVMGNTSKGGGGGIASGPGNGGFAGSSTLIIKFSKVDNNTSTGGPMSGGGGVANGGVATIVHTEVNNNTAPGSLGGGILNHGTMTINFGEVNGNTAPTPGPSGGGGGGIANISFSAFLPPGVPSGVLTLNHTEVNDNSASGPGGGIFELGVSNGPPLPGGALTLNHSDVESNTAVSGGGIWLTAGSPVVLVHSHVRENTPDNCFPPASVPGCEG